MRLGTTKINSASTLRRPPPPPPPYFLSFLCERTERGRYVLPKESPAQVYLAQADFEMRIGGLSTALGLLNKVLLLLFTDSIPLCKKKSLVYFSLLFSRSTLYLTSQSSRESSPWSSLFTLPFFFKASCEVIKHRSSVSQLDMNE